MLLWIVGFLAIAARAVWEITDPIQPGDFKGLFYIRDYVAVLPAAICWYLAAIRSKPNKQKINTWKTARCYIDNIRKRPVPPAILMALLTFAICASINVMVLHTRAHILDEANYLFQAKVFTSGNLWVDPPHAPSEFFELAYMIITGKQWYSSFFPAQSALLALAVPIGVTHLVNPFLTAILVMLTFYVGSKMFDRTTGLLAAVLMAVSPFVMFQGASYFSHISTACLFIVSVMLLWTGKRPGRDFPSLGFFCGLILLLRPVSAAVLAFYTGVFLLWRCYEKQISFIGMLKNGVLAALGIMPGLAAMLLYNQHMTGNPLTTPHQVALPTELISFGMHSVKNTIINMTGLSVDLLGLPLLSLLPIGVYALSNDRKWLKPAAILALLYIAAYSLYPYHGLSYGPRFYFEIVPILLIICSKGVLQVPAVLQRIGRTSQDVAEWRTVLLCCASILLCLAGVLPYRVSVYHQRAHLYDIRQLVKESVEPPAVVFIKDSGVPSITSYITGFQLNDIHLQAPVIFARDLKDRNKEILTAYPGRRAYILDSQLQKVSLLQISEKGP